MSTRRKDGVIMCGMPKNDTVSPTESITFSYLLLDTLPYEGPWIRGVVHTLDEALEYFVDNVKTKSLSEQKVSEQELVQRALDDNWEDDYFSHWVEKWCGTKRICTYKYNTRTKSLEKQQKRFGEKGDSDQETEETDDPK